MLLSAAAPPEALGPARLNLSTWPADYQERYGVFAVRCSKCHELERALTSRLEVGEWKGHLRKMMRRPGSGINERDAQRIVEFLEFYARERASTEAAASTP